MSKSENILSVIVLTYKPNWDKLRNTVLSIVLQKDINFEIIISDDGSQENHFDKLQTLFSSIYFTKYVLVESTNNTGTVKNLQRAIEVAKGNYIKDISPGDYLYSEYILKEWLDFVIENNILVSFGKAVYYNADEKFSIISHRSVPKYIKGYRDSLNKDVRKEYLLLDDMALGAAFLGKKDVINEYLSKMVDKVTLGEDFLFTLMVFNGVELKLFNKNVVWYEFGHGVSTSGDRIFSDIMLKDWENMHTLLLDFDRTDLFSIRFLIYIKLYNALNNKFLKRLLRYVVLPDTLIWKFKVSKNVEYTDTDVDMSFLDSITLKH